MRQRSFAALFDVKQKRRMFTAEEDTLLTRVVQDRRFSNWIDVASQIPGRTARQCRDRWANYLCPVNKNAAWTRDEDELLVAKFAEIGPRWTVIAKFFDGRSENNVKNRWYTHLRPKLGASSPADPGPAPEKRQPLPSITTLMPELMIDSMLSPEDLAQGMVGPPVYPRAMRFT
jgi:hypothetical protein